MLLWNRTSPRAPGTFYRGDLRRRHTKFAAKSFFFHNCKSSTTDARTDKSIPRVITNATGPSIAMSIEIAKIIAGEVTTRRDKKPLCVLSDVSFSSIIAQVSPAILQRSILHGTARDFWPGRREAQSNKSNNEETGKQKLYNVRNPVTHFINILLWTEGTELLKVHGKFVAKLWIEEFLLLGRIYGNSKNMAYRLSHTDSNARRIICHGLSQCIASRI